MPLFQTRTNCFLLLLSPLATTIGFISTLLRAETIPLGVFVPTVLTGFFFVCHLSDLYSDYPHFRVYLLDHSFLFRISTVSQLFILIISILAMYRPVLLLLPM